MLEILGYQFSAFLRILFDASMDAQCEHNVKPLKNLRAQGQPLELKYSNTYCVLL